MNTERKADRMTDTHKARIHKIAGWDEDDIEEYLLKECCRLEAEIDALEAKVEDVEARLQKMTTAHGLLNTQGIEQWDELQSERQKVKELEAQVTEKDRTIEYYRWKDGNCDDDDASMSCADCPMSVECDRETASRNRLACPYCGVYPCSCKQKDAPKEADNKDDDNSQPSLSAIGQMFSDDGIEDIPEKSDDEKCPDNPETCGHYKLMDGFANWCLKHHCKCTGKNPKEK